MSLKVWVVLLLLLVFSSSFFFLNILMKSFLFPLRLDLRIRGKNYTMYTYGGITCIIYVDFNNFFFYSCSFHFIIIIIHYLYNILLFGIFYLCTSSISFIQCCLLTVFCFISVFFPYNYIFITISVFIMWIFPVFDI